MQVVVQRVQRAAVSVAWLARKVADVRVFPDQEDRMNRSLLDTGGSLLAISQFTLYGRLSKGRRLSFVEAAAPEMGAALYDRFRAEVAALGVPVERGVFGAHMEIDMVADGPVTLLLRRETGQNGTMRVADPETS